MLKPIRHIYLATLFVFVASCFTSLQTLESSELILPAGRQVLPAPGMMVPPSPAITPLMVKGLKVYPDNPFHFDFVIDTGDSHIKNDDLKEQSNMLIKYFLSALTVADQDQWVNLSPYEKNRILPESFAQTDLGIDLLAQDYLLKQLTATLMYPENNEGKKFWAEIYSKLKAQNINGQVNLNAVNKVWIVPDYAKVLESGNVAYIKESHLKVLMEEDYRAMNLSSPKSLPAGRQGFIGDPGNINAQSMKNIILPIIEKEINQGKNFAPLRQMYQSMILAAWFKKKLRNSILGQEYVGANKVKGIEINDTGSKEKIYAQYLQAFKKGVYNYIKDPDPTDVGSGAGLPRKYFAGGVVAGAEVTKTTEIISVPLAMIIQQKAKGNFAMVTAQLSADQQTGTFIPSNTLKAQLTSLHFKYKTKHFGETQSFKDFLDFLKEEGSDIDTLALKDQRQIINGLTQPVRKYYSNAFRGTQDRRAVRFTNLRDFLISSHDLDEQTKVVFSRIALQVSNQGNALVDLHEFLEGVEQYFKEEKRVYFVQLVALINGLLDQAMTSVPTEIQFPAFTPQIKPSEVFKKQVADYYARYQMFFKERGVTLTGKGFLRFLKDDMQVNLVALMNKDFYDYIAGLLNPMLQFVREAHINAQLRTGLRIISMDNPFNIKYEDLKKYLQENVEPNDPTAFRMIDAQAKSMSLHHAYSFVNAQVLATDVERILKEDVVRKAYKKDLIDFVAALVQTNNNSQLIESPLVSQNRLQLVIDSRVPRIAPSAIFVRKIDVLIDSYRDHCLSRSVKPEGFEAFQAYVHSMEKKKLTDLMEEDIKRHVKGLFGIIRTNLGDIAPNTITKQEFKVILARAFKDDIATSNTLLEAMRAITSNDYVQVQLDKIEKQAIIHYIDLTFEGYQIAVIRLIEDKLKESQAMIAPNELKFDDDLGGIDFDSQKLDLNVQKQGQGIAFPTLHKEDLAQMHIDSLTPVIVKISPLLSLSELLP